jgi:hypothetical protein
VKATSFGQIYLVLLVTRRYSVRSVANVSGVNAAYRRHDIHRLNDGFLMASDPLTWWIGSGSVKFIDPVGWARSWPLMR